MKDFDALRHRVEETAERLSLAQSERHEETQSLIGILRDLEEKYSAQEQQFAYYRERLEPLERSNAQLASLVENLLELIDRGFGDSSLDPLREASNMASAMLKTDMKPLDDSHAGANSEAPSDSDGDPAGELASDMDEADSGAEPEMASTEEISEPHAAVPDEAPEMATLDDIEIDEVASDAIEATGEIEEEAQIIGDLVELVDESAEIANEEPAAVADEADAVATQEESTDEQDDARFGEVNDLELEEVPLANLEQDIETASDVIGADLATVDAVAAVDMSDFIAADEGMPAVAVAEDDAPTPADMVSGDEAITGAETPQAEDSAVQFEDVSHAVLELELEEDASAGVDDLPENVKKAAEASKSGDATDEVDSIAALALAMEEETESSNAPPPAQSDIRSLMLRVEALAKKAEAMRQAQAQDFAKADDGEQASDRQEAPAAEEAATETGGKKAGVAA